MAGRKIAFLHVPKSSGMAIEAGIVSSLAPKAPFLNHMDHSTFGDFQEFETFPATEKRRIVSSPDEFPQDADFVSGHFALSNLKTAYPDHEFFSVVREPKCRLLSHWIYWRSFSDEALLRVGTMAERVKISRGTFFEFLTSKSIGCQTDNCFARMLLWPNQTIPENDFISSEHDDKIFAQVSAELARFDCVGMYEDKQLDHKLSHYLKCEFSRPRINETTTRSDATFPEFSKELDQNTCRR